MAGTTANGAPTDHAVTTIRPHGTGHRRLLTRPLGYAGTGRVDNYAATPTALRANGQYEYLQFGPPTPSRTSTHALPVYAG
jgi:hypothetical protein